MIDSYEILKAPLSTEKAVREAEATNTIIFEVNPKATKKQIKWAIEKMFDVKVMKVRVLNTPDGRKKAYIKLHPDTPAIDITTKLGMV